MEINMDWLFSIIRIAGVAFPFASSLVQLQAELDNKNLSKRIKRLEDPISHLHDDISKVAELICSNLKIQNQNTLSFDTEFYDNYARPLSMLESQHCIHGNHSIVHRYYAGISLCEPSFVMYLCALNEDEEKMKRLISVTETCKPGQWLNGISIASDLGLPEPVVEAVFQIYQSKGLGILSQEIGTINYLCQA
jgi:hypothetical protein